MVFFKPVYSKIKFWQMIGRGTRLCPDLFGPGDDKQDFRVFDLCFNFDFFRENPEGIEGSGVVPLGTRLFCSRVQLLSRVQATPDLDPDKTVARGLITELHGEVEAMHRENFIVRMHLEAVDRFREPATWEQLSDADRDVLQREVAGLPSEVETDEFESRMFDLSALRMQLALAEGNMSVVEGHRQRMVEIAMLLEEKTTIPAVKAQLEYLASMQESGFWESIDLSGIEELRLRLRGLVPFLDRKKQKIVYTDFQGFLSDQSLTPPQIRFVEMVIDQLTARGVMEASALYEPPFSNLHADGPEALFDGKQNVIDGIFDTLKEVQPGLRVNAG